LSMKAAIAEISERLVPPAENRLSFSTFPMFVPSLSW
jgi:hypothetical protein